MCLKIKEVSVWEEDVSRLEDALLSSAAGNIETDLPVMRIGY
jgi:hypothetical protein